MSALRLSRRALLVAGAAGAVGLAFGLPSACSAASSPRRVNAFVQFAPDGTIVLVNPAIEMGQGAETALAQVLADALDADWSRVRVVAAPYDAAYGNPHFDHRLVTADSAATRAFWPLLREAGATARAVLVWNAARQWAVDAAGLHTEAGTVRHADGRVLGYAELAAGAEVPAASRLPVLAPPPPRLLGQPLARRDLADKLAGRTRFGVDSRPRGTAVAVLLRPPGPGAVPEAVDAAAARAVPGVIDVLELAAPMPGVAVVARHTWAALRGREALRVRWRAADGEPYDSEAELARLQALARDGAAAEPQAVAAVVRGGDAPGVAAAGARVLSLAFASRHVTHAALEPINALATPTWLGQSVDLTASTQAPSLDMRTVARTIKRLPPMIAVQATAVGGAFGRRVDNEAAGAAAWLARRLGQPVQVLQFVGDDIPAGQVRTLAAQQLQATLDGQGRIVEWRHRTVGSSTIARMFADRFAKERRDQTLIDGQEHLYRVPRQHIESVHRPSPLACGFVRGVGAGFNTFGVESLVDEAALAAGADPIAYRLQMLDDARARGVLQALADWDTPGPAGAAAGVALLHLRGSHVAMRAWVERVDGVGQVRRLQAVVDCGRVVNPALAATQVEGAALLGLSFALREALHFADGAARSRSLAEYPVLRLPELPPVNCRFVGSQAEAPQGLGEIALPVVAPAVANAWRRLGGARLLTTPFELA